MRLGGGRGGRGSAGRGGGSPCGGGRGGGGGGGGGDGRGGGQGGDGGPGEPGVEARGVDEHRPLGAHRDAAARPPGARHGRQRLPTQHRPIQYTGQRGNL